jgi:hypothetical protein
MPETERRDRLSLVSQRRYDWLLFTLFAAGMAACGVLVFVIVSAAQGASATIDYRQQRHGDHGDDAGHLTV